MPNNILILEDESNRLERMLPLLESKCTGYVVHHWSDAHVMIKQMTDFLADTTLICLDHDLYTQNASDPDPGDGLDMARFLATRKPQCPVLIHSSNADRALMMQGELDLAGWECRRISPIGDDWIQTQWIATVMKCMKHH